MMCVNAPAFDMDQCAPSSSGEMISLPQRGVQMGDASIEVSKGHGDQKARNPIEP
jgi:hypothetical protein